MVFKKKLIAAIAAISMIATSFVAMTTVSADATLPVVKAEIVKGADTVNGTDIGLKFTFENLAQNCTGLLFHIEIPADLKNPKNKAITSLTTFKNVVAYDENNDVNPFADGWDAVVDGTDIFVNWTTYDDMSFTNSDWFEFDFKGVTDYSALPKGSLKLTDVQVVYEDLTAQTTKKGTLKVVDPTTSVTPEDPKPDYVYDEKNPSATNWKAADTDVAPSVYEGTDGSKAVGAKATVNPGSDKNTYTGLVWKVKSADGAKTYTYTQGVNITGAADFVYGIVINGATESDVDLNSFGVAVK